MTDTNPPVTDHALLRYLERGCLVDIEGLRNSIAQECRDAIRSGASSLTIGDIRFEFRNGVVVTVTLKSTGNGPCKARRETLARGKA